MTIEDIPDIPEFINMLGATTGAKYRGLWNSAKGTYDGVKMLVTEPGKVWEAVSSGASDFIEHPIQNTKKFVSETYNDIIDAVWRSTPQDMAEDVGEIVGDLAVDALTAGSGAAITTGLKAGAKKLTVRAGKTVTKTVAKTASKTAIKEAGKKTIKELMPDTKTVKKWVKKELPTDKGWLKNVVTAGGDINVLKKNHYQAIFPNQKNSIKNTLQKTGKNTAKEIREEFAEDKAVNLAKNKIINETKENVAEEVKDKAVKKIKDEVVDNTENSVQISGAVNQTETKSILEGVEDTNLGEPRYVGRKISNSVYKKLRSKTPSREIKDKVNENIVFPLHEDRALPGKIGDIDVLEADHIVPMNSITKMEGFEKLTFEQQREVLNYEENFVGLSKSANTSKQSKSYSEWTHYKKGSPQEIEVDKTFRDQMIQKEKILEKKLQKMIDNFIKQNNGEI